MTMSGMGDSLKNSVSQAKNSPWTFFRDTALSPFGQVKHLEKNLELSFPDAPEAPTPAPVQEMPVAGDAASRAANRNKRAAMQARGGRASTIITGSRLGD